MFARLAGYGVISLLLKWFAMDFLQEYESSDSEATDVYNSTNIDVKASDKGASTSVVNVRAVRQVYLITYSQADLHKFPDRNSFAQAVLRSFDSSNTNVEHWVCCKEVHESTGGYHYHMAVKLQRCKRWLSCKRYLEENYGISVHFSDVHHNYYSAWKYTTKKDKFVVESDGHPDLSDCKGPKTETASLCRKKYIEDSDDDEEEFSEEFYESPSDDASETCHESDSKGKKRKKRLSSFELSEIIVTKEIKTRTQLLAYANNQKCQGKNDIAEFIVNRGPRVVSEVLTTAWEIAERATEAGKITENSCSNLTRSSRRRMY